MIKTLNGIELRNLQEQVLKNKEEIAKHWDVDRVLADFGIKMLGRFDSYDDIKDFDEGEGYGNAYLIGTEEPYDVYVWTRPNVNAGQPVAYWLDIGPISLVGPQGPAPAIFNDGEYIYYVDTETNVRHNIIATADLKGQSTRWYFGSVLPPMVNATAPGTMYLHTPSGNVYSINDSGDWVYAGNLKGESGSQGIGGPAPQIYVQDNYIVSQDPITGNISRIVSLQQITGPQGPTGDAGGFIHIVGKLSTEDALPTPSEIGNLTVAYLIGDNEDLYIQIGETSATATWNNVGPLNVATLVTVDGQYQNTWNADTKLDKVTSAGLLRAYCINPDGSQNTISVASNSNTWRTDRFATLVNSSMGGEDDRSKMENINVGYLLSPAPVQPFHTANKEYVDENFAPNLIKDYPDTGTVQAVVMTAKQGTSDRRYGVYTISTSTAGVTSGRLVQYFSANSGEEGTGLGDGRILQHDPVQPLQVANKRYVDNKFLEKDTSTTDYNQVYVKSAPGGQGTINVTKSTLGDSVVQRQSDGNIYVPEVPAEGVDAASKAYVDSKVKTYRHRISGVLTNTANETKLITFIVYNNNPDTLITPDTTKTTFPTIATKYLQPSTPVMFQQTTSEYEMDMIKTTSSNAFNLITSGDRYNFSTALEFTDNVVEC